MVRIEEVLTQKNIPHRLIELRQEAFTVDDVVNFSKGDINPSEICKTIILKGKKSGKRYAILLRGSDRLNFSAAKQLLGEEMRIGDAGDVKEVTGVEPGAVCPFLLDVPLFVDKRVLELENINCGSGEHLYGLEFVPEDLGKGVSYQVGDFAKEAT
ncbi:MAG: YbaK/EbsC family protein [Candidatus Sungbacteria bacterium]|nr:YbaK/EbsC family protein [Candidatus Sungbacteria bacterium]